MLAAHIGVSVLRVLAGFAIGASLAIVAGAADRAVAGGWKPGSIPPSRRCAQIPSLAWVPLLLLWLGIDEAPKLTLIAIGAFFPVYLNLVAGIQEC